MPRKVNWQGYLPSDFETPEQAQERRLVLVRILPRVTGKGNLDVQEQLKYCIPEARCHSEACPECRRDFRRRLVKEFCRQGMHNAVWTRVSLVPDRLLFSEAKLSQANLENIVKRLHRNVKRSALSDDIIIGGVDISLNAMNNVIQGWQLQLYFLINRAHTGKLEKDVRSAFRRGAVKSFAFQPVERKDILKLISALTYSYKNYFELRSSYHESRLKADGTPRTNGRDLPLKPGHLSDLSLWLGQYDVGSRLFLCNLKRRRVQPGKLKLRIRGALRK